MCPLRHRYVRDIFEVGWYILTCPSVPSGEKERVLVTLTGAQVAVTVWDMKLVNSHAIRDTSLAAGVERFSFGLYSGALEFHLWVQNNKFSSISGAYILGRYLSVRWGYLFKPICGCAIDRILMCPLRDIIECMMMKCPSVSDWLAPLTRGW